MGALTDALTDKNRRRLIIEGGAALINSEVASKRGISGMAVKAAFKVVKKVKPGMIEQAMAGLIDDFALKIDPFYDSFLESGGTDASAYFVKHGAQISTALLEITDARAKRNRHRTLKGAYNKLRPQAMKHCQEAMPGIGALVQEHT